MSEGGDGVRRASPDGLTVCEEMRDHVAPYALGVLDEPERRAFGDHLGRCPRCRASLADNERAVAALSFAGALASPHRLPPALRTRILRRVAELPEAPVVPPPVPSRVSATQWPRLVAIARGTHLGWRTLAGAAAAAALALSLAWTAQLGVALARERALRMELAQELAAVSGQREIVLEVVDAREKTTRLLRPGAGAPRKFATSYGKLYTRPDMPHVVAMTGRMPAPPPGEAFHLWVRLDGQTRLGGVIEINADGFGQLVFDADRNGPAYEMAWLTLQPPAPAGQTPAGAALLRWDPN